MAFRDLNFSTKIIDLITEEIYINNNDLICLQYPFRSLSFGSTLSNTSRLACMLWQSLPFRKPIYHL